ncbi:phosphomannomutase [Diaminobutyricimonas aerilata]|uniref:Phosphomannomutase n=1 Tax=Diaminobutyricimonas aerilata TaxID=1162967 RepID=A0A2M9CH31_9MICO|nr:phospho-sugar mutase [Diaminobutyricimonas aerilata]PJJ71189.1 phosphomannomutase [Diaminobutyricimonas aerilata]
MSAPLGAARAWLEQDPDPVTRAELERLLHDAEGGVINAETELRSRFGSRLTFGTAGLRGELGAGPARMNRVLVAQAASGFAAFLLSREEHPSIVIGYDGRTNSDVFARDTAELMAGAGVRAILLPRALPTPVLAFAVRHLGVSAGVMVTASHNPPRDNGYKVYLGGADAGSQIVAPTDAEIQARILEAAERDIRLFSRSGDFEIAGEEVLDEYVARTAAIAGDSGGLVPFVYTAMHGVGWETARRVFDVAGFGEPVVVADQIEPDPEFPTVAFPNPEEPGAMDLAFATATRVGAELVLANDPDADRLAVAVPDGEGWRRLSGNEVGVLLGWRAAERAHGGGTLAASLVSSPVLRTIADAHGLDFAETLTGFKWISRPPGLVFGFEEALGYLVDPEKVRDKDGISAAVAVLALAAELRRNDRTLDDALDDVAERIGGFASTQISLRVSDLGEIPRMMRELRENPPTHVGSLAVDRIDDFAEGFGDFGPTDLIRLWTEGGSRIILRPSGTEPKLKIYIDATSTDGDGRARRRAAAAVVAELDEGMRRLVG